MKKLRLLTLVILLAVFVCSAVACDLSISHVYSVEYSFDEAEHWFACLSDSCDSRKSVEAHDLTDAVVVIEDGIAYNYYECTVCDYDTMVEIDGSVVVTTGDALKAALSSEEENVLIFLGSDVAVDIGTYWNMGGANTESITIDGLGYKLTLSSTYRSYFNLANADGVLNLKNMTLTNAHRGTHFFDYTTHFNCDVVADNVVFEKTPLITSGDTAVFNDCKFTQTGADIYGLWVMSGADVTVNGGEFTTDRGIKIADEDSAHELTVLNVSDTKFDTNKKAAILVTTNYGAEITVNNLDITNCAADSENEVWIDDGRTATADLITVIGGNVIIEP